jgi:hypothetical protein
VQLSLRAFHSLYKTAAEISEPVRARIKTQEAHAHRGDTQSGRDPIQSGESTTLVEPEPLRILFTATTNSAVENYLLKLFAHLEEAKTYYSDLTKGTELRGGVELKEDETRVETFKWIEELPQKVLLLASDGIYAGKDNILGHYRSESAVKEKGKSSLNWSQCIVAGTIWQAYKSVCEQGIGGTGGANVLEPSFAPSATLSRKQRRKKKSSMWSLSTKPAKCPSATQPFL